MGPPVPLDVLIIEDSSLLQSAIKRVLESQKLQVRGAGTTEEALRILSSGARPSLILLDLRVPRLGGRELLRQLKANADWAPIPVVLMSGDRDSASLHGVAGFLLKPFELEELVATVQRTAAK